MKGMRIRRNSHTLKLGELGGFVVVHLAQTLMGRPHGVLFALLASSYPVPPFHF